MDPSLDPRLQDPAPISSNHPRAQTPEESKSSPTEYPDPTGKESPQARPQHTTSPNTATQQSTQNHHKYYSAPTPSSYSSETPGSVQQTYPYNAGVPQYGGASQTSSGYGAPLPTVAEVAADLKRPRACEACRQLKVKCEPDDVMPGTCRRCFRSGRQCVVTIPSRKRQKKTDSRVAELERRIDALQASLHAQQGPDHGQSEALHSNSSPEASGHSQLAALDDARAALFAEQHTGPWAAQSATDSRQGEQVEVGTATSRSSLKRKAPDHDLGARVTNTTSVAGSTKKAPIFFDLLPPQPSKGKPAYVDIIDRHLIDAKAAYRCFDRYVNAMAPALPFVVFQPGIGAEDVRYQTPILFLAIVGVACGVIRPDLQPSLIAESMRVYADRCICRGEKSMEIVQALLISTIWYVPPEKYEELNFNQLIHMAAVMAIDLGMGKRVKAGQKLKTNFDSMASKAVPRIPHAHAPETRRTWLGCYFMCANSAMSLRRPLLIRWTGYMDDSLELLENSQDVLASDKWLSCLVRGQHIAEDVGFQFSMDDPTVEISITEPKTQYQLKAFERQLAEWRNSTPRHLRNDLFAHSNNITTLYVHEIAMHHHHHNIDDFKPPYTVQAEVGTPEREAISPAHIESLTICIQSIHGAFEALLAMDLEKVRSLPTLSFVRTSYAAVALIKLSSAVADPNRRFGEVFKLEDLKADYYLDTLIKHLRAAGEGERSRVAFKFSFIFSMLRTWFQKRNEPESRGTAVENGTTNAFVQGKIGQGQPTIHQDPGSSQWSRVQEPKPSEPSSGCSGLHMLSELASSSNSGAPVTTAMGPSVLAATGSGSWPQQYAGPSGFPTDSYFGTLSGVDMDTMGFNVEDWTDLNNAMAPMFSDATWMGVAWDQGGIGVLQ